MRVHDSPPFGSLALASGGWGFRFLPVFTPCSLPACPPAIVAPSPVPLAGSPSGGARGRGFLRLSRAACTLCPFFIFSPEAGMANLTPSFDDYVAFLSETASLQAMTAASHAGRPAVAAVDQALLDRFGEVVREYSQRQRVGKAARTVLEEHGYTWLKSGVPTPNSVVFTTAAIYKCP